MSGKRRRWLDAHGGLGAVAIQQGAREIGPLLARQVQQGIHRRTRKHGGNRVGGKLCVDLEDGHVAAHAQHERKLRLGRVQIPLRALDLLVGVQLLGLDLQHLDLGDRAVLVARANQLGQVAQRRLCFLLRAERLPRGHRVEVGSGAAGSRASGVRRPRPLRATSNARLAALLRRPRLPETESKSADPSEIPTLQASAEHPPPEHAKDRPIPPENAGLGAALARRASPRAPSTAASARIRSSPCSRNKRRASGRRSWAGTSNSPSGSRASAAKWQQTENQECAWQSAKCETKGLHGN